MDKTFLRCHYTLAKYGLKKIFPKFCKCENTSHIIKIPIFLLTVLILIIFVPFFLFFKFYKKLVIFILKLRLNTKFVDLITGCNLLTSMSKNDGIVIGSTWFIDSDKNPEDIFNVISKKAWLEFTSPNMDKRMVAVRKSFMGYLYNEVVENLYPHDVLKFIRHGKSEIREDELGEVLNYHCNIKPMPLNGTFNWDFSIIDAPLIKNNGEKSYLMIIRMHHYIVDGITMYNLIKRITKKDQGETTYGEVISTKLKSEQKKRNNSTNLTTLTTYNTPVNLMHVSHMKDKQTKGHVSVLMEPTQNSVLKLKQIRKKLPGASFNAVILTAYSASLAEYFKEYTPKNVEIPTKLELIAPVQINMDRFSQYFGDKRTTKLGNDFTFLSVDIPIVPADRKHVPIETYLLERLNTITRNFQEYNECMDYTFNYKMSNTYFDVFPTKVTFACIKFAAYNILMSVFPGGPKLTTIQDDGIRDVLVTIPLVPNKYNMNFMCLSYDDKFQLQQIIDENKFESLEKMDEVLRNTLKYIDILYNQTTRK